MFLADNPIMYPAAIATRIFIINVFLGVFFQLPINRFILRIC